MSRGLEGGGGDVELSGLLTHLNDLRQQGRMTWNERTHGLLGTLDEIVRALQGDGFVENEEPTATRRPDRSRAGGVWQGVNTCTGSVASAVWVARPLSPAATVFIRIDGGWITRPGRDPDEEEGGQG